MIANGTIQFEVITGGGFDENQDPIPVTQDWGEPVSCNTRENHSSNKGTYQDGNFKIASYTILIELCDIPNAKRVRLSYYGRHIGDYAVQSIRELGNVGRIKIVV